MQSRFRLTLAVQIESHSILYDIVLTNYKLQCYIVYNIMEYKLCSLEVTIDISYIPYTLRFTQINSKTKRPIYVTKKSSNVLCTIIYTVVPIRITPILI